MHAYLSWLTRDLVISLLIQEGGKISPCVDFRNKGKSYTTQVFKTMQGVHRWIRPFDIVFAAYCCGIFVPASVCVLYNFPLA